MAKPPATPKTTSKTKGAKKPKQPKRTAEQKLADKLKTKHYTDIRKIFAATGFKRLSDASDKEFIFEGQRTDVDDVFVHENVVVLSEYTSASAENVSSHLKTKKLPFDKILANPVGFIDYFKGKFPTIASSIAPGYHSSEIRVRILYCALYNVNAGHQANTPGPVYMNYSAVRYFSAISDAIKISARHELLHFLRVGIAELGHDGAISTSVPSSTFKGLVLPEAHSNFNDGYKIVSFYADAAALLRTAYVLRKDGWRDDTNLYQRMVSKTKIEAIRAYLKTEKRVFINNIIVTLPLDVKPLDDSGNTIDTKTLNSAAPVNIQLPARPNSVCVIDGQHRIFAYHQTVVDDVEIAARRKRQNLLVTGIIYPPTISQAEKEKFEAKLFLEINSTQTNPKSDLKQAVNLIIEPFSTESVATQVLFGLGKTGPLSGFIQQNFFDEARLKTASIVSFALVPLVKTSGTDSLFCIWNSADKAGVADASNAAALTEYINFCVSTINTVLGAFRRNLDNTRWVADKKIPGYMISTKGINSFLIVLRHLIQKGYSLAPADLANKLSGFNSFKADEYGSSHYAAMAQNIVKDYFDAPAAVPVTPQK